MSQNMLKQPIHRASLLALALFGVLIYLTWIPEKKVSDEMADTYWPLEIELQGHLGEWARSHQMVQDTLNFHATRLNAMAHSLSCKWEYESCCDDPQSLAEGGSVFRGKLSMRLAHKDLRRAILQKLIKDGYLSLQSSKSQGDWTMGWADLNLPVPGSRYDLLLKDVGFSLQMPEGRSNKFDHS
jgi:hypothetical protein